MTTAAIPFGTFVCEYSGESLSRRVLEKQEARKQRVLTVDKNKNSSFVTYAIEMNDKRSDFYVDSVCLDGFINCFDCIADDVIVNV
jgi:hypothetical protein